MNIMKGDNEWKDEDEGEGTKDEYEGDGKEKKFIWERRNEKMNMREKE